MKITGSTIKYLIKAHIEKLKKLRYMTKSNKITVGTIINSIEPLCYIDIFQMENYKNILVDIINTMYRLYKCIKYSKKKFNLYKQLIPILNKI